MKKLFTPAAFALLMFNACNTKEEDKTTTVDSTRDSIMGMDSPATTPPTTNPAPVSANFMDMMTKNMQDMKAVPSSGNPDNDFAALMKIHHMGALQMAEAEVANGSDATLKAMAQKMISDQQKEIAELNNFLSGHAAHGGGEGFHKEAMKQMDEMKMSMDHSGSTDKQFAEMMIMHHQGGIDMARAYLRSGGHETKLKTMASNIIKAQEKEIAELKKWLGKV